MVDTLSRDFGQGFLEEAYEGVRGGQVAQILDSPIFPQAPTQRFILTDYAQTLNVLDQYGLRARAVYQVPRTGSYRCYISGDDHSELWLKQSSGARSCIASSLSWTGFAEFNKYSSQQSEPIALNAGEEIEIEILLK